jgi:hypothetical protein
MGKAIKTFAVWILLAAIAAAAADENPKENAVSHSATVVRDKAVEAGHATKEAAMTVGHRTKKAAEAIGHRTATAAKAVAREVKEGAIEVGHAVAGDSAK